MKKINIIIFFLLVISTIHLSAQNIDWVKSIGRIGGGLTGVGIGLDNQKNVYSIGSYNGTADFDPSPTSTYTITSTNTAMYIQKLDANGNFIWAKSITNTVAKAIKVDAVGNSYLIGSIGAGVLVDLDPGPATYTLSNSIANIFLLKLDVNGDFVWAKQLTASQAIDFSSSTIDAAGNLLISGSYWGSSNVSSIVTTQFNLFLVKLNSNTGAFIWGKQFAFVSTAKIVSDGSNNVYLCGAFTGSVDIDPSGGTTTLISNLSGSGTQDIYIVKLNSNGILTWGKNFGSISANVLVSDFSLDQTHGSLFLTGRYSAVNDFDPSAVTANLAYPGGAASFVAKYDLNGNYKWAKGFNIQMANGTISYHNSYIKADIQGGVLAIGTYSAPFDADPNMGTYTISPNGSLDTYVYKLDSLGQFVWGGTMGGSGNCYARGMDIDNQGNIYYTGYFTNTTDFDPSVVNNDVTAMGPTDAFISKIKGCSHNAPDICLVTVDSLALNNVIYWDKSLYTSADTFIVYRYDAFTTNYLRIGSKSFIQPNFLIDTARTIGGPNGGNPQYSSYRYKLAIKSVCGDLGTKGLYHESIFIQQNNQNFSWNAYGIEGQTSPATGYQFMRDNTNTGNWQVLVNTGGLSTTDPNYASYPNGNWRVDALGFSCNPTAKLSPNAVVNRSKSNVKNNFVVTSANELELNANVFLSPNPAKTELTVNFSNHQQTKTEFVITDVLGKIVSKTETLELNKITIPLNDLSSGVYFLKIKQGKLQVTKKFIKE